jgi:hypothetical protein
MDINKLVQLVYGDISSLQPCTNHFYGNTEPYIIEYPFAYKYQDEILQSIQDYTKVYKYFPTDDGAFNDNLKIEIVWSMV